MLDLAFHGLVLVRVILAFINFLLGLLLYLLSLEAWEMIFVSLGARIEYL